MRDETYGRDSVSPAPPLQDPLSLKNELDNNGIYEKPTQIGQNSKKEILDNNNNKEYNSAKSQTNTNNNSNISLNTSLNNKSTLTGNPNYSDEKGQVILMEDMPVEAIEFQHEDEEPHKINPEKIEIPKVNKNYLSCFDGYNRPNDYHFELTGIINVIYYFICLGVLLIVFIDYDNFTLQPKMHIAFFYGSWGVVGIFFVIPKYMQYRRNYDNNFIPIVSTIIIYIFKIIFCFGFWSNFELYENEEEKFSYNEKDPRTIALFYLIYFIFGIIYYLTITIFIIKQKAINFLWFFIIGFIYVGLSTLIIYLISKDNDKYEDDTYIVGLIFYSLEVIFYNFGIGLSYCRKVLNEYLTPWNILHIEIYRIYPLLFLVSIPVIIIAALIVSCFMGLRMNFYI